MSSILGIDTIKPETELVVKVEDILGLSDMDVFTSWLHAKRIEIMKVYFSHGKESGPWGSKIQRLASIASEHGCTVDSIDYTDLMDPDLRVERLRDILKKEEESFILVGSSMGGYVSLVAADDVKTHAVFLLAPALYIPDYKQQEYFPATEYVEIVHGWSDDVIPPGHSIRFAKEADCTLHLISGDHRLNGSIEMVEGLFGRFLCRVLPVNNH